jgi:hypothetical protein
LIKVLKLDSMVVKKDGRDKLENLVFEVFCIFYTLYL